eukprot:1155703-Pelagomonas_calceolata.AAC.1
MQAGSVDFELQAVPPPTANQRRSVRHTASSLDIKQRVEQHKLVLAARVVIDDLNTRFPPTELAWSPQSPASAPAPKPDNMSDSSSDSSDSSLSNSGCSSADEQEPAQKNGMKQASEPATVASKAAEF